MNLKRLPEATRASSVMSAAARRLRSRLSLAMLADKYTDCAGAELLENRSVTVAEAETCWQGLLEDVVALDRPDFSCDQITEYFEWQDGLPEYQESEACIALEACD